MKQVERKCCSLRHEQGGNIYRWRIDFAVFVREIGNRICGMTDKAEKISKEHGRLETVKMTMTDNTGFLYKELGTESFYRSIARIGILDKKVVLYKEGKEEVSESRSIVITDVESMTVENMLKIKASHWNIEMQHWLLDIQLREDAKTARKGNATTNGTILRRLCMAVRQYDKKLAGKPMNRFLMANEHDIKRIEGLLFGDVVANAGK